MNSKKIELWYDKTSDPAEPMWCVSLCEADGEEIKCLSTHEERADALTKAQAAAEKRGIELYERD